MKYFLIFSALLSFSSFVHAAAHGPSSPKNEKNSFEKRENSSFDDTKEIQLENIPSVFRPSSAFANQIRALAYPYLPPQRAFGPEVGVQDAKNPEWIWNARLTRIQNTDERDWIEDLPETVELTWIGHDYRGKRILKKESISKNRIVPLKEDFRHRYVGYFRTALYQFQNNLAQFIESKANGYCALSRDSADPAVQEIFQLWTVYKWGYGFDRNYVILPRDLYDRLFRLAKRISYSDDRICWTHYFYGLKTYAGAAQFPINFGSNTSTERLSQFFQDINKSSPSEPPKFTLGVKRPNFSLKMTSPYGKHERTRFNIQNPTHLKVDAYGSGIQFEFSHIRNLSFEEFMMMLVRNHHAFASSGLRFAPSVDPNLVYAFAEWVFVSALETHEDEKDIPYFHDFDFKGMGSMGHDLDVVLHRLSRTLSNEVLTPSKFSPLPGEY